jgi:predicted CXXCH cytochrome family protein
MKKKLLLVVIALLALALAVLAGCAVEEEPVKVPAADKIPVEQVSAKAAYVGSDACSTCHSGVMNNWLESNHTDKVTKGPAFGAEYAGNVYDWVREGWGNFQTYVVLDEKDKNTLYVGTYKYDWKDVAIVVGKNRKQRYGVYYDGSPMEAWLATTEDGGINWKLDKSTTVQFAGNKERAGYNFLFMEMDAAKKVEKTSAYGEFRSWQERCAACHTTGFDPVAWKDAKAAYVAGQRADLKDFFVADLRIGCESCHGAGGNHVKKPNKDTIINPAKLTSYEAQKMVCEQCHTRTQSNTLHGAGSNDLRGFDLMTLVATGEGGYQDVAKYTRPAWGTGNRQVSIDGKARRDHQMDIELRLVEYISDGKNPHGTMSCFTCHDAHNVGNNKGKNGSYSLKKSAAELCASCHGDKGADLLKAVKNAAEGFDKYGYGNWGSEGARSSRGHMFNLNKEGKTYGVTPDKYIWTLKKDGNAAEKKDWEPIWPWEKEAFEKQGRKVEIGAEPWKSNN